jgi:hypothetical protein
MFGLQKPLKETRIKLCNTLALQLCYSAVNTGPLQQKNPRRITAAEMKYMRKTAGYTWTDHKINTDFAKERTETCWSV